MTKEELINWLEAVITAERNNPLPGPDKIPVFGIDAQLKAADILAELKGWKTHHNYCQKAPRPKGLGPL